jgi:hypothetical protein
MLSKFFIPEQSKRWRLCKEGKERKQNPNSLVAPELNLRTFDLDLAVAAAGPLGTYFI